MWLLWVLCLLLAPVGAAVGARHLRSAAPEEMEESEDQKDIEAIARHQPPPFHSGYFVASMLPSSSEPTATHPLRYHPVRFSPPTQASYRIVCVAGANCGRETPRHALSSTCNWDLSCNSATTPVYYQLSAL
jgi:hypothetical protein